MMATKPTLLSAKQYERLSILGKLEHLNENIAFINEFLSAELPLSLDDFEPLTKRHIDKKARILMVDVVYRTNIASTYNGAYLMTKWFIVAIYVTLKARAAQDADILAYQILLLPCYRTMTNLLSYCNTDKIYELVLTKLESLALREVNSIGELDIIGSLKVMPHTKVQFLTLNFYASRMRTKRGVSDPLNMRIRIGLFPIDVAGDSKTRAIYNALNRFMFRYVQGYQYTIHETVWAQYANTLNVDLPPGVLDDWIMKMLQVPVQPDEEPFPDNKPNKFEAYPIWYARVLTNNGSNIHVNTTRRSNAWNRRERALLNAASSSATTFGVNDAVAAAVDEIFKREIAALSPESGIAFSSDEPSPPPPPIMPTLPSGNAPTLPPSNKLLKISAAIASAGVAALLSRYAYQRWGNPVVNTNPTLAGVDNAPLL